MNITPITLTAAMIRVALALGFACATVGGVQARPTVLELFTSQGCSSCPPADALLGDLAQRGDVLALGFHVDYWDNLGWRDPLSAPGATARQRDYARLFHRNGIYTPQMVIDGRRQAVGSDQDAVVGAITASEPRDVAPVTIAADGASATLGAGAASGTVLLIRYVRDLATVVPRGENAGTTAHDINAVEEIKPLGA